MSATKFPWGPIQSFGDMVFAGAGLPANISTSCSPPNATPEVNRPRLPSPSNRYGYNMYGYSPGPVIAYPSTWVLSLMTTGRLSQSDSWAALESAYNTWRALWRGTHTHRGVAGTTGELGDLVVVDTFGTTYTAEAELRTFPLKPQLGEVYSMDLTFTWYVREDWA